MNYKCKGCGGSMVYSPKHGKMFCPHCEAIGNEIKSGDDSLTNCPNCGAELEVGIYDSSSVCPYCDNYIIYDKRVTEQYAPDRIIPFEVDKEHAISLLKDTFKKRVFTPGAFIDEVRLKGTKGYYVPFFLYDVEANGNYQGHGTKVRKWRSGNYDYTETAHYDVRRGVNAKYHEIPADASEKMPDATMDLMEPYDYNRLLQFDPKFMSGFFGEVYNNPETSYRYRAFDKAKASTANLVAQSISGYTTLSPDPRSTNSQIKQTGYKYALFPVWMYNFVWHDTSYPIYVNGQTGKVVGKTPISKLKVFLYGLTHGGLTFGALVVLYRILEVFF